MEALLTALDAVKTGNYEKHRNLAVVPLIRTNGQQGLDYLVLDQASKSGLTVVETRVVEELEIKNDTGKDVVLVAGEIIVGGGQNRAVAANAYVAAGYAGKIPTRCVEAHRWDRGKGTAFTEYGGHAPTTITGALHDQNEVWRNVDHTIMGARSVTPTRDLTQVYKDNKEQFDSLASRFTCLPNQTGIVTVMGLGDHKKMALDLFDSPDVMKHHYDKLLQARFAEAMPFSEAGLDFSMDEVASFLKYLRTAQLQERSIVSAGRDYTVMTDISVGSALFKDKTAVYVGAVSR